MKLTKLKKLAKDKKKVEVDLNKFKFEKGEDIATRMAKLKGKFIPQEDIDKKSKMKLTLEDVKKYGTEEEQRFLNDWKKLKTNKV